MDQNGTEPVFRASPRGLVKCCSSFQVGYHMKTKIFQAQPGNSNARVMEESCHSGTEPSPLGPARGMALGRAVLVTQAGAAPVHPKLLPIGFPLPNRALVIRWCDVQSGSLAPAAQAGLQGDKSWEREVSGLGYTVKQEEIFPY